MKTFYQERHKRHQAQMMKYLKFVFNDHFVIMAFFLVGGIGLYYSNLIKSLPHPFPQGRWIVAVICLLLLSVGKLATLLKEADQIFLLPKESQLATYLQQAIGSSRLLAYGVQIVGVAAVMPLFVIATNQSFKMYFILLFMMLLLKEASLWLQAIQLYQNYPRWLLLFYWGLSAVTIVIGVFQPLIGLIVAVVVVSCLVLLYRRYSYSHLFNWQDAIKREDNRLMRIYKFINLFTDVPEVKMTVKRRRYLDWVFQSITKDQRHTYDYLFWRHYIRSNEYSGLTLRLVIIGVLIVLFNDNFYLSLVIALLFVYLLIFQMIPLAQQFSYMVLQHLYPIDSTVKQKSLQRLLFAVGSVMNVCLATASALGMHSFIGSVVILVILFVELSILIYVYVPRRLRKIEA